MCSTFSSLSSLICAQSKSIPVEIPNPTTTDICWYLFQSGDISGANVLNHATGTSDTGVLVDSPTITDSSATLSSTTKYIKLPSIDLITTPLYDFTISLWIKVSSAQTSHFNIFVLGNNNNYVNSICLSYLVTGTGGSATVRINTVIGGPGTGSIDSTSRPISSVFDNNYHLHTLTISSTGVCRIYYDGVQWGTPTKNTLAVENTSVVGRIAWANPKWAHNGSVSDIRIYKKLLSASQVSLLYSNGRATTNA